MRNSRSVILSAILTAALACSSAEAQEKKPIEFKAVENPLEQERVRLKTEQDNEIVMPPEAMENPPPGTVKRTKEPQKKPLESVESAETDLKPGKKTVEGTVSSQPVQPIKSVTAPADAPVQKTEEPPPAAKNILLMVPKEGIQDIKRHWEKRRSALEARDQATADAELKKISAIKKENGAGNLFGIASALVRESRQAVQGRDYSRAQSLSESAVEMAPELPSAHFQLALVALKGPRTNVVFAIKAAQEGIRYSLRDPPTAINTTANAILVFGMAVILAFLLFTISVVVKYGRLIVHDSSHLFPEGAPPLFAGMTVLLFLFAPLVLGAGVIPCILFWSVVAWVYASRRERAVLAVCVTAFALLPLAYPSIAVMIDQGENDATQAYRVFRDGEAAADVASVIREAENGSKDPYKLWGAALWLKRSGRYAQAEPFLRKAIEAIPKSSDLHVNMGNLYLVQDRFYEAQNAYNRALELDPFNALGHFNLSQLFFRFGAIEKGQREHQEAVRLDPGLLEGAATNSSSINLFVIDAQPSNADLFRLLLEPASPRRALIASLLERYTIGDFSRTDMPFVFGAAAALIALLSLLRRRLSPSGFCAKCGSPSCTRCNPEMTAHTHCGQCFHLYILRDVPDSRMRGRKEVETWQRTRRKRFLSWSMAVLVPGSGQVLTGSPIAGFLVMCLTGLAAVLMVTAGGPLPGRFSDMHVFFLWMRMSVLFVAAVVYVQSLRSSFRKA